MPAFLQFTDNPFIAFAVLFPAAIILLLIYLAPALVAFHRDHENKVGVLTANFMGGWSIIGWIACMVWAFRD